MRLGILTTTLLAASLHASSIVYDILTTEEALRLRLWIVRVPSPSNIADAPSRLQCQKLESSGIHHVYLSLMNFSCACYPSSGLESGVEVLLGVKRNSVCAVTQSRVQWHSEICPCHVSCSNPIY